MSEKLDDLHRKYGFLCIQLEILQNQVMECKKLIAEAMNQPRKPIENDTVTSDDLLSDRAK